MFNLTILVNFPEVFPWSSFAGFHGDCVDHWISFLSSESCLSSLWSSLLWSARRSPVVEAVRIHGVHKGCGGPQW